MIESTLAALLGLVAGDFFDVSLKNATLAYGRTSRIISSCAGLKFFH